MNPPEKIFIELWDDPTGNNIPSICRVHLPSNVENIGVEYHLAPVWHDAVKDPPKEIGVYLVEWSERPYLWELGYWTGNCWDNFYWKRPFPTQPTRYRKGDLK
jgi:hypothetical protein